MRTLALGLAAAATLAACGKKVGEPTGLAPRRMADALYAVIAADRAVYTREVVNRLQNEAKVLKASEHWKDDKALPLPAQMLRMGAETVRKANAGFSYALLSQWPMNRQNGPSTEAERSGLKDVATTGGSFYGEETLGGKRYFTAVYADKAVSEACVTCHNQNADSPRRDFKVGDVMGGLVIRIPIE